MNNYIDERFIPYQRPQKAIKPTAYDKKGAPLTRKQNSDGIILRSLRIMAAIFLLFLSTFGGEEVRNADETIGKAIKKCVVYAGIIGGCWLMLVLLSNILNAVTLLPMWSLIAIFAATILLTAGIKTK